MASQNSLEIVLAARSRPFGHHIFHFLDIDFRVIGLWIVGELVFGSAPQRSRNFLNSLAANFLMISELN